MIDEDCSLSACLIAVKTPSKGGHRRPAAGVWNAASRGGGIADEDDEGSDDGEAVSDAAAGGIAAILDRCVQLPLPHAVEEMIERVNGDIMGRIKCCH